jgi:tetratricopeptide (TPR) repeat protein
MFDPGRSFKMVKTAQSKVKERKVVSEQIGSPKNGARIKEENYNSLLSEIKRINEISKRGEVDNDAFKDDLKILAERVQQNKSAILSRDPAIYYKFRAIQGEALHYFDQVSLSEISELYDEARKLYGEIWRLIKKQPLTERDRLVVKNKIRFIVEGLEYLYRDGSFDKALMYANGLYEIITVYLEADGKTAFGTKAKVAYLQGRLYRQRANGAGDFEQAIAKFYESSENYYNVALEVVDKPDQSESQVIYARTSAAASLGFGIGFLNYTRSHLQRAKNVITPARLAFLKDDGKPRCEIHFHYLNMLISSILRAEAGGLNSMGGGGAVPGDSEATAAEKRNKLEMARSLLDESLQYFKKKRHKYLVHAYFNRAILHYFFGPDQYTQARECLKEVKGLSPHNNKWMANALIVESRINLMENRLDEAFHTAAEACRLSSTDYRPVYCEALLARGMASMQKGALLIAQEDFEEALNLNNGANQKVETVALMRLTRIAIAQHKPEESRRLFAQAQEAMKSIEHGYIIDEFEKLKADLHVEMNSFFIPYTEADLEWSRHEKNLRRWLLQRALGSKHNVKAAANLLGLTRKSVYQWIKDLNYKDSEN